MSNIEKVRSLSNNTLRELGADGNISGVLTSLGIKSDPRIRKIIIERFEELGIERNKYKRYDYSINDVKLAVKDSICMIDVVKKLGLTAHGSNTTRIKRLIEENNITTSHFNINQAMQRGKKVWNEEEIFCEGSEYHRSLLRKAVVKFKIIEEYVCSKCGVGPEWNDEPLLIELDHINGISNDNRPTNLRWLCPNCHSQTPTHKNGNIAP